MAINKGWKGGSGGSELRAEFNGSERIALDGTGLSFHGAAPVAQSAHIADVSVTGTYATDDTPIETAINAILVVLENHGLTATS
jgi:hypothetical protein